MGAYIYPMPLVLWGFFFAGVFLRWSVDSVRRFKKHRRLEETCLFVERRLFHMRVTSGYTLQEMQGLITRIGGEDLEYPEHRTRVCRLLIFATERCRMLSSREEKESARYCADWLANQVVALQEYEFCDQKLIDESLDTVEILFGLAGNTRSSLRM